MFYLLHEFLVYIDGDLIYYLIWFITIFSCGNKDYIYYYYILKDLSTPQKSDAKLFCQTNIKIASSALWRDFSGVPIKCIYNKNRLGYKTIEISYF